MTATSVQERIVPPRSFRVPLEVPVMLYHRERRLLAMGLNLSPSGIFVETRLRLEVGERCQLELGLGDDGYLVAAVVARIDAGRGVGLCFSDLERDVELAVIAFVSRRREELERADYARARATPEASTLAGRIPGSVAARPLRRPPNPSREGVRLPLHAILLTTILLLASTWLGAEYLDFSAWPPAFPEATANERWSEPRRSRAADPAPAPAAGEEPDSSQIPQPIANRLAAHIADGDRRLALGDLSTPHGDSALDHYRAALAVDPNNERARAGVAAVCDAYVERARGRAGAGDIADARWRLQRALEILTADPAAETLPDRNARAGAVERELALLGRRPAR